MSFAATPAGSKRVFGCFLAFLSFCAQAQHSVTARTNYYAVSGNTLTEIYNSMRERRPWKEKLPYDAQTLWEVQWRFDLSPSGSSCRLNSLRTTTTLTITLPHWTPPTNADPAVVQEWKRFFVALRDHEGGHAAIALDAARALQSLTTSSFESSDCHGLRRQINDSCNRLLEQHRRREREYDAQTRHGATQGVRLTLPFERRERPRPSR